MLFAPTVSLLDPKETFPEPSIEPMVRADWLAANVQVNHCQKPSPARCHPSKHHEIEIAPPAAPFIPPLAIRIAALGSR